MAVAISQTAVRSACNAARCEDHHEGRPSLMRIPDLVIVLCPAGHVYDLIHEADWAHSNLEHLSGAPDWAVVCHGAI